MEHSHNVVKSSEVINVNVCNPADESLGKIEELMLDKSNGQVRYAVLSFGGILGIGEKLFAIPWKVLTYDASKHAFILNVDKEKLKNAPGFDKNNWPDFEDETWGGEIFQFYG